MSEAYLEPSQTSAMEIFCKNFHRKCSAEF